MCLLLSNIDILSNRHFKLMKYLCQHTKLTKTHARIKSTNTLSHNEGQSKTAPAYVSIHRKVKSLVGIDSMLPTTGQY
jgi:hypothetical protein